MQPSTLNLRDEDEDELSMMKGMTSPALLDEMIHMVNTDGVQNNVCWCMESPQELKTRVWEFMLWVMGHSFSWTHLWLWYKKARITRNRKKQNTKPNVSASYIIIFWSLKKHWILWFLSCGNRAAKHMNKCLKNPKTQKPNVSTTYITCAWRLWKHWIFRFLGLPAKTQKPKNPMFPQLTLHMLDLSENIGFLGLLAAKTQKPNVSTTYITYAWSLWKHWVLGFLGLSSALGPL